MLRRHLRIVFFLHSAGGHQRSLNERLWIGRCRLESKHFPQHSALSTQHSALSTQHSALNGGDGDFEAMDCEAATSCFLVTAIHVLTGLADSVDHLIERNHELAISGEGEI